VRKYIPQANGIIVRYPNELAVDEAKTTWLIEKAQEVG
jgi:hypothetical protein